MKTRKEKIIPIIFVSLSCILFLIAIVLMLNTNYFEFTNKAETKKNEQNQIKEEIENSKIEESNANINQIEDNQNLSIDDEQNRNQESNQQVIVDESNKENVPSNDKDLNNSISKNEVDVVSYFESQNNMLTKNGNQEDHSLREKAKNAFVTIVDFIFYDKEVKCYTFKELTTTAKLKVIKLALAIDHKIDEYFPDYKEVIKDKYDNIKGKLAIKYLEFTSTLCDSVGVDTCNQAKEDFNTMKESFGFTWELIKELASSGSSKVKEFYESWRDSE